MGLSISETYEELAHAERWGIFVGLAPTFLILSEKLK